MAVFLYITSGRQMASFSIVRGEPKAGRLSRAYDVICYTNSIKKLLYNKKMCMAGRRFMQCNSCNCI